MILENIKDFDWYNEPENVRFIEEGLLIEAAPQTDFWQNSDSGFYKDNGHLFAENRLGNFDLCAKWHFMKIKDSAQCGIMVRSDAANWIKAGLLSPNPYHPQIGVVVANQGASDWSVTDIPEGTKDLWFQIKRRGRDFVVFYSLDGEKFNQIRMAHLPKTANETKAGAYACSPKNESFECVLEQIDIQEKL